MLLFLLDVSRVGMSVCRQCVAARERSFRQKNEFAYSVSVSKMKAHLILLPVALCVTENKNDCRIRYSNSENTRSKQIEVRQCWLSFGAESFVFQLAI
jgi:hypothetical protein